MRIWIGRRLPLGFRAGVSIPLGNQPPIRQQRASAPKSATGDFVYVIRGSNGMVKIGVSSDPISRIASLQTASPDMLTLAYAAAAKGDAYRIEQAAHDILARQRQAGEWFQVPVDMAVAAISTASFRLNEPIVAIDPALVGQVVALAQATGGSGVALPPGYMSVRSGLIGGAIWIGLMGWGLLNLFPPEMAWPIIVGSALVFCAILAVASR